MNMAMAHMESTYKMQCLQFLNNLNETIEGTYKFINHYYPYSSSPPPPSAPLPPPDHIRLLAEKESLQLENMSSCGNQGQLVSLERMTFYCLEDSRFLIKN